MRIEAVERLLPWRRPFLMIDRLIACTPHREITTLKCVTANDPLMIERATAARLPAMLLLEGLSQSAALLYRLSYENATGTLPLLGFLTASFERRSILSGAALRFEVRTVKMTRKGGVFEGQALADDVVVARAELGFAVKRNAGEGEDGS